ncbi:hypothetical protein NQ317_004512 [Molorchus minor]|uniref:Synaptonemal complex protein 1 n=1 Tax=Molorchus minor TaxID=1323400 RepID=A0ABQ9JWL8_9CUCU|nr:hypothetical protein NQ317_004512 [Molorchus minor]
MSFSKAKIQRFNDVKPCVPSPAAYNVNATTKDKPKNGILNQLERFLDPKSPCIETGSTHSTPCLFRTPSILRRKKAGYSVTKLKPSKKQLFSQDLENLKEKNCGIDLQQQIDEFKDKMGKLEKQKNELDLEKAKFETELGKLNIEHAENLQKMAEKIRGRHDEELEAIRSDYEYLLEANRKEMKELKKNCDTFPNLIENKDAELKNKEKELKALEENCIEMQRKHSLEIERFKKEHQTEIQDIEFELLKTMTELQKEKENATNKIIEMENLMEREIKKMHEEFEEEKRI